MNSKGLFHVFLWSLEASVLSSSLLGEVIRAPAREFATTRTEASPKLWPPACRCWSVPVSEIRPRLSSAGGGGGGGGGAGA